jgi:hypothetical protein
MTVRPIRALEDVFREQPASDLDPHAVVGTREFDIVDGGERHRAEEGEQDGANEVHGAANVFHRSKVTKTTK